MDICAGTHRCWDRSLYLARACLKSQPAPGYSSKICRMCMGRNDVKTRVFFNSSPGVAYFKTLLHLKKKRFSRIKTKAINGPGLNKF